MDRLEKLAVIELYHGTPALFLHGKPVFGTFLRTVTPTPEGFPNEAAVSHYAGAGIHFYSVDAGTYSNPPEWRDPDFYDFSPVVKKFEPILRVDPQAYFFIRIQLEMPEWWQKRFPQECELLSDGKRAAQSFASKIWQSQFKAFLKAYITYLQSIGLAERVIAYQPGGGNTTEWVKESAMGNLCGDYSQPMQAHFREWLRSCYHSDEAELRKAWNEPYATFESAQVPAPDGLLRIVQPTFRDPFSEQPEIDYFACWNDLCADLAIDACRSIKEATRQDALAGVFYGKLFELAWNSAFFGDGIESGYGAYQRSGHLCTHRLLQSPYIDFVTSSYTYSFRGIGGEGAPMLPTESVRLHGKLHLYDDDSRTHLSMHAGENYGRPETLEDSLAILKRNFTEVLTRGAAISWIGGLPASPYVDPSQEPAFQALLQKFQELGTFALDLDRSPASEIAVLLDEESLLYETVSNRLDLPLIVQQRLYGLPRLGAPFDTYLLDDFIEGRLKPYKLYIFLNAFHLDAVRRERLKDQLRRDGRVGLWIYAAGYLNSGARPAFGLEQMADLTGFMFAKGDHPWGPMMNLVDFDHPITRGLAQDLFWGTNSLLAPVFHLADSGARVLGNVVYSEGRCRAGLGVKEFSEWKSVYCAVPNLPAGVLRGVARYAGVHLYSEAGDVLYATRELLGVHTAGGGEREFSLPGKVEQVYELFTGQEVAKDCDRFQVRLAPSSTALYYTGNRLQYDCFFNHQSEI